MNYLFVYGTLMRGLPSAMSAFLERHAEWLGEARVSGYIYDLGSYPGLIYEPDSEKFVYGQVYDVKYPEQVWPVLDRYEGAEYERQVVGLAGEEGIPPAAHAYVYGGATGDKILISSGDYRLYYPTRERHNLFLKKGRG